jgi:signal transduction histidine kinase
MPSAVRRLDAPPEVSRQRGAAQGDTALDDPKRSFLRVVSHELRTPLNSILGFSEILASELYGPLGVAQYREYAAIIRSSGEKLLKLVNQVVEIARLQTGDLEMNLQAEQLEPILEGLSDGQHEVLAARNLRLIVAPCVGFEAMADARALRSVLSHLLQNAIAVSPEGGAIEVSVRQRRDRLEIIVRNEGDGVDPADLERLVRPFEQGENALARHTEGAGLGLAICDLACRAMGGRLKLDSARGQGFEAHVVLPAP